jgi:hypothetical protein
MIAQLMCGGKVRCPKWQKLRVARDSGQLETRTRYTEHLFDKNQ